MFLDTSGLFSLYDSHDVSHDAAVREYRRAERYWTHQALATRLADKYGTVVESDATQIPRLLGEAGCL